MYPFYVPGPLLLIAKEVQLFPCLGIYSGIFAIYLQFLSNESRTRSANVIFYILCLLYGFCAATVVCDSLVDIFGVSNKFTCKNIIFIIRCAVASYYLCTITSTSNWLTVNIKSHCDCPRNSKYLLWLHRSMHYGTHKPFNLYLLFVLFT